MSAPQDSETQAVEFGTPAARRRRQKQGGIVIGLLALALACVAYGSSHQAATPSPSPSTAALRTSAPASRKPPTMKQHNARGRIKR